MTENTTTQNQIVIERFFDAPADLIWKMWTEAEHFKNWYGPKGFTVPVAKMDVRVGGKRHICMQSPDGSMKMWTTGEFTELIPNERLVYTDSFSDEHGNVVSPADYGMSEDQHAAQTIVTVELETVDGRTRMTMTHAGVPGNEQGANEGWGQSFSKMEDYVATIRS